MSDLTPETTPTEGNVLKAARDRNWLLIAFLTVTVLLVGCWIIFQRPLAEINRLLPAVGLARIPASAQNLRIERQGRFFGTRVAYIRFEAPADHLAQFVEACAPATADGPAPMVSIRFGPRSPGWMTWPRNVQGNMYHWTPDGASVWLAVDELSNTAYIGVFEARPAWLRRLVD